jgi:hypothetical protein
MEPELKRLASRRGRERKRRWRTSWFESLGQSRDNLISNLIASGHLYWRCRLETVVSITVS